MSKNNKLKAFVRIDGTGRVIPSSLILQRFKPKVGKWKEVNSTLCCNSSTPTNNVLFRISAISGPCDSILSGSNVIEKNFPFPFKVNGVYPTTIEEINVIGATFTDENDNLLNTFGQNIQLTIVNLENQTMTFVTIDLDSISYVQNCL